MDFYPENYAVTLTVPFSDPTGERVSPISATAKLLDGDGVLILDLGSLTIAAGAISVDVVIPGAYNILPAGGTRAVRILSVMLTLSGGEIERRLSYAIETAKRLVVMDNSFMTYETAQLMSSDFVDSLGWAVSDEGMRKTALVEAHRRLTQIPMKYHPLNVEGKIIREEDNVILRDEWVELGYEDFASWPQHFRLSLRRAQFIEANQLLRGDPMSERRRSGVISETIGESSVKISEGIVDYGVNTETLSALAGYVYFNMRIGRT